MVGRTNPYLFTPPAQFRNKSSSSRWSDVRGPELETDSSEIKIKAMLTVVQIITDNTDFVSQEDTLY